MGHFSEILLSSAIQLSAAFALSFVVFYLIKLRSKEKTHISFCNFLGLKKPVSQIDKIFWLVLFTAIVFTGVSIFVQFYFSPSLRGFLLGDASPYRKILRDGFGPMQIFSGLLYCFIQSAGAEEVLFRGLIARRLIQRFGFKTGNLIQALLFWLVHLLFFKFATGQWISWIQLNALLMSFGLGYLLGYMNHRKGGQSIVPSWLIHGSINFVTFLVLGFWAIILGGGHNGSM